MEPQDLGTLYPRLYHMAELGSWESIRRHGLLSTRGLIELFEVVEPRRTEILRNRRPASVLLEHAVHGEAVVRDQIPLSEARLDACLTDMSFGEWLEVLNSRVFFWLDIPHLETLLGARAYRKSAHDVIVVDTAALLERYSDRITLSPINSGATMYKSPERGSRTFLPIADYPFEERRLARGVQNAIVELAVDDGVRDILAVALAVERRQAARGEGEVLWRRGS
jgi:hypothetical protein